jgi:hypothetical protein
MQMLIEVGKSCKSNTHQCLEGRLGRVKSREAPILCSVSSRESV